MPLTPEIRERAARAGIPVVDEVPEAPSPRRLLGGSALLLNDGAAVAEVLVSRPPDRALLEALETSLGRPVLISIAAEATIAAVDVSASALDRLLGAAESAGADALLLVPGASALAVLPSGRRVALPGAADISHPWEPQVVTSSAGARWRLSLRSRSLLLARRLLPAVPDASRLRLPAALLRAADKGEGRFALVGDFGSGRSLVLYALLSRALDCSGRHGLLVTDQVEYPLRPPASVLEVLPSTAATADLRRSPVPDVLALDAPADDLDPSLFRSPLVLTVSDVPVEGLVTVPFSRSAEGLVVSVPEAFEA